MISDRDVAFYKDNGYVVVENLVEPDVVLEMKRVIAELVEKARGVTSHTDVYDLEPTHSPESPRVRRIKQPHLVAPVFWEFGKSPKMLSVLTKLLGPNVRLHGTKLNTKDPKYGSPVEWHQDWAFYPHTNDDLLAVGVMLDDLELENGPLMLLPGTHKGPIHSHHADGRFCGAMDPSVSKLPYEKAVTITGKAGSASFHHVRLVHGSGQNTSNKPRQLLLYECSSADAWPLVNFKTLEEFDSRMLCGKSTIEPRTESVPIRMPLPPALNQGSIYENQTASRSRYFEIQPDPVAAK
ncbi:MAG: phytanoyl-CoA dioxygenase family protein [Betaproteobacteria bacterium]